MLKISLISYPHIEDISDIKLIRTDFFFRKNLLILIQRVLFYFHDTINKYTINSVLKHIDLVFLAVREIVPNRHRGDSSLWLRPWPVACSSGQLDRRYGHLDHSHGGDLHVSSYQQVSGGPYCIPYRTSGAVRTSLAGKYGNCKEPAFAHWSTAALHSQSRCLTDSGATQPGRGQ